MTPVSRQERRHIETRAEIVRAARQLVIESGAQSLTVREIARRTDFTPFRPVSLLRERSPGDPARDRARQPDRCSRVTWSASRWTCRPTSASSRWAWSTSQFARDHAEEVTLLFDSITAIDPFDPRPPTKRFCCPPGSSSSSSTPSARASSRASSSSTRPTCSSSCTVPGRTSTAWPGRGLHEHHEDLFGERARDLLRAFVNGLSTEWTAMKRRIFLTERLARVGIRRPWVTVAAWLLLAIVGVATFAVFGDSLVASDDFVNKPESKQVEALVAERVPGHRRRHRDRRRPLARTHDRRRGVPAARRRPRGATSAPSGRTTSPASFRTSTSRPPRRCRICCRARCRVRRPAGRRKRPPRRSPSSSQTTGTPRSSSSSSPAAPATPTSTWTSFTTSSPMPTATTASRSRSPAARPGRRAPACWRSPTCARGELHRHPDRARHPAVRVRRRWSRRSSPSGWRLSRSPSPWP